jgi:hypothetical protein
MLKRVVPEGIIVQEVVEDIEREEGVSARLVELSGLRAGPPSSPATTLGSARFVTLGSPSSFFSFPQGKWFLSHTMTHHLLAVAVYFAYPVIILSHYDSAW